jgi:hypothetical protein
MASSDTYSDLGAGQESPKRVGAPGLSMLSLEMPDKMSRLSLQNSPGVPSYALSKLRTNAPIIPQSQIAESQSASRSNLSGVYSRVEDKNSRKRADPTTAKKTADKKKAAALFVPDESSESDNGGPRKKQKRIVLSKVKATPRGSRARTTSTKHSTATTTGWADKSSKKVLSEAVKHEAEREAEDLQHMVSSISAKLLQCSMHGTTNVYPHAATSHHARQYNPVKRSAPSYTTWHRPHIESNKLHPCKTEHCNYHATRCPKQTRAGHDFEP